MKKKGLALILIVALLFSISGAAFATPGVDEPGVAGIFIDPINDITLNPVELEDMQNNGLVIPVTGYVGYKSSDAPHGNPKLDILQVIGQKYNTSTMSWENHTSIINRSGALKSEPNAFGTNPGQNFNSFDTTPWSINSTGQYRVYAYATFTTGASDTETEEFTVEVISPSITVYPMAAPNIAEIILAKYGVAANQSTGKGKTKETINLIQKTAAYMGPQTLFNDVEKSIIEGDIEVCNPAYWNAVLTFLNSFGFSFDYTLDNYKADLQAEL